MPRIDSKRLPLRLKRWLTLLQNNGFKFSGLSRLFILHKTKGSSWLAEFRGIWFQSSDHLVDATLPATEVKSSELNIRNGTNNLHYYYQQSLLHHDSLSLF
ncbi:uncharacterized protein LOC110767331 [Prunus avium]|uniref:Uncharacterized protein LOC110767331 n=1 Tax=Prunus avium TaxID=42229 RepID=A0A6P5TGP1_PRUAV|nr:uncharacterized protein LOC110767331 [Prunus avium]